MKLALTSFYYLSWEIWFGNSWKLLRIDQSRFYNFSNPAEFKNIINTQHSQSILHYIIYSTRLYITIHNICNINQVWFRQAISFRLVWGHLSSCVNVKNFIYMKPWFGESIMQGVTFTLIYIKASRGRGQRSLPPLMYRGPSHIQINLS